MVFCIFALATGIVASITCKVGMAIVDKIKLRRQWIYGYYLEH